MLLLYWIFRGNYTVFDYKLITLLKPPGCKNDNLVIFVFPPAKNRAFGVSDANSIKTRGCIPERFVI